jgi:opacity protein-like surface antigen
LAHPARCSQSFEFKELQCQRSWSAGIGVDYAITNSVFGRIEYRYTNLITSGFAGAAINSAAAANRVPINDLRAPSLDGRLEI